MSDMTKAGKAYDGDQIQVLEGLEAVRKRPGMYIGSTGPRGLHHLVYEIVDNSIDEALAGFCDTIVVRIQPGNIICVSDNGRGIPVGVQHKTGLPAVTVVFTILHAGGKFGGGSYKVSSGLHGVGASVVNALSQWLEVEVVSDGVLYTQRFERGKAVTELLNKGPVTDGRQNGTTVRFKADGEIFKETTVYTYDTGAGRAGAGGSHRQHLLLQRGPQLLCGVLKRPQGRGRGAHPPGRDPLRRQIPGRGGLGGGGHAVHRQL